MIILSILIPTFNYRKGLVEILDSLIICEKEYLEKIEIIISDDSESRLLDSNQLEFYQYYFNNFKYIYNKNRIGSGFNWNKLIEISEGKFYWLLHHDEEIYNPTKTISNLIDSLNDPYKVLLFKVIKKNTLNIFKYKINLYKFHTAPNYFTNFFIGNNKLILLLNIIGPPSAFIISKEIKYKYNTNLKWLIDVEFYSKLFSSLKVNEIKKVGINKGFIISNQNNPSSITKDLKKNKKLSKNLIKYEKKIIFKNFLLKEFIQSYFLWMIYKFHYTINTIYINIYFLSKIEK